MVTKQDIITAIRNLDRFLKVPELKGAVVKYNANGSPYAFTGGFNMVFQLNEASTGKKWAFRVWHVPMGENKERFAVISRYLAKVKSPYFVEFIYDEGALLVNGQLLDTIRMEWVDGFLLKDYIENNLSSKMKLEALAAEFLSMCKHLKNIQVSHGDLQEGNIIINADGKLKLVDYDSVCIPEIEGQQGLVTGLKGYQHPSRLKGEAVASLKADFFSELIIFLSLTAIAQKPALWSEYQIKETQYLLFRETDFINFTTTKIYNDLKGINSTIDELLSVLCEYLESSHFTELVPFYSLKPSGITSAAMQDRRKEVTPKITEFSIVPKRLKRPQGVVLRWNTVNSTSVSIFQDGMLVKSQCEPQGQLTVTVDNSSFGKLNKIAFHIRASDNTYRSVDSSPLSIVVEGNNGLLSYFRNFKLIVLSLLLILSCSIVAFYFFPRSSDPPVEPPSPTSNPTDVPPSETQAGSEPISNVEIPVTPPVFVGDNEKPPVKAVPVIKKPKAKVVKKASVQPIPKSGGLKPLPFEVDKGNN